MGILSLMIWVSVIVGIIPKSWNRYIVPVSLTVIQWVMDFSERIKQLQTVSDQVKASGIAALKVMLNEYMCTSHCHDGLV